MDAIDSSLVDWSRAQFALTAMYHWIFVPLTLGLGVIMAIMETLYVRTGREFWKQTAKFWMKLFGINFAMGVATGIILEFEFGTNWSNYSWFVGDIFGAPLAIEGIVAFFMESTFIAIMYFGWNKVGKGAHLASTWLTIIGATLSAWWILVANAWMQYPVGMEFNPDTVRNEMVDFAAVALSPVAVVKFCHTVTSSWVLGAMFVVGVSCWYLLRGRHTDFAKASIRVACWFGLVAALLTAHTGHQSGRDIALHQPMKLAAAEGLYEGGTSQGLVLGGVLTPGVDWAAPTEQNRFLFQVEMPCALSFLATHELDGYVPGIRNLLEGGYPLLAGGVVLSAGEKMQRGRTAIAALATYRTSRDAAEKQVALKTLRANFDCFGYGYLKSPAELVPNVPLTFYSFRIMVMLGGYFIALFAGLLLLGKYIMRWKWALLLIVLTTPLAWLASQAGWVVAEVGRQPWAIQGLLPNVAAISRLDVGSVQTTFFIFLGLFTLLLVAEVSIMACAIATGPETDNTAA
ncbi:MAG: cytochrome ubiquinol oxidase subunit I [Akkermansia sp.]|nr:cytochrome ubiquinol oxidase subunit I [Akkermansia sp.]